MNRLLADRALVTIKFDFWLSPVEIPSTEDHFIHWLEILHHPMNIKASSKPLRQNQTNQRMAAIKTKNLTLKTCYQFYR